MQRPAFPSRPTPRLTPAVLAAALAGTLVAGPALADDVGRVGRIHSLRINTPGSDDHPSFHGAVTLMLRGSSDQVEYRWGGSSCPGQKLNADQINLLMAAFTARTRTIVTPRYTMEGNGTRCLVGFELTGG